MKYKELMEKLEELKSSGLVTDDTDIIAEDSVDAEYLVNDVCVAEDSYIADHGTTVILIKIF